LRPLAIEELSVRALRNLARVDIAPSPRFNVLFGENGQGKTNLLEAIYVGATTKSFRTARPGDLVAHGGEIASTRLKVVEDGDVREQSVGMRAGMRMAKVDGKRAASSAAYAVRTPVVLFHPGDLQLSMGSGSERRRVLDRISLYRSPSSLGDLEAYTRALRERQRALEMRGVSASDLGEWEELIVRHGLGIMSVRRESSAELSAATKAAFRRIAAPELILDVDYAPAAPEEAEAYRAALVEARPRDLRRKSATVGPHRDDLSLVLNGHRVRNVASQGQHRAIVLSLKAAEIDVIGAARGVRPILLLDDVSSELDRSRTSALFSFLREQRGQVFLTTTRRELIEMGADFSPADRADFSVVKGAVTSGN
jgi:DNA replication and repair protein RecF